MRRRKLSTQQIETFRAVMLLGSVNAAAQEFGVSQPSLTRMLRRTEDLVGFRLFELIRNRLVPTAEARLLFSHVEYISNQLDDLDGAIDRIREGGRGNFRFAASINLARSLIPEALVVFRRHYPELPVQLDTLQLPSVVDYLALGTGECFVSIVPLQHPAVQSRAVQSAPLVCVMPVDHALAAKKAILPGDINDFPLIKFDDERWYGQKINQALQGEGTRGRPAITVRGSESVIDLASRGLGIGVVDAFSAFQIERYGLTARPVARSTPFSLHVQTYRDLPMSRFARELEEILISLCSETQQPQCD